MPIGKNSIKRAVNNGYSNVKTSAPDMENSEVIPTPVEVAEKVAPKTVKAQKTPSTAKKTACKKTVKPVENEAQKVEEKPVKKAPAKKCVKTQKTERVELGGELPIYLL